MIYLLSVLKLYLTLRSNVEYRRYVPVLFSITNIRGSSIKYFVSLVGYKTGL